MRIGFSFSPGGLLLPYHLGVLSSLSYHNYVTDSTPLAGSSAGAIAVASHASGVNSHHALEATVRVSQSLLLGLNEHRPNLQRQRRHQRQQRRRRHPWISISQGRLLQSLQYELEGLLSPDAHEIINGRSGITALAHRQLWPRNRKMLQTHFPSRSDLVNAICDSSMFPYFLTNQPCLIHYNNIQQDDGDDDGDDDDDVDGRNKRRFQLNNNQKKKNIFSSWNFSSQGRQKQRRNNPASTGRTLFPPPPARMTVDGLFACSLERIGCPNFNDIGIVHSTKSIDGSDDSSNDDDDGDNNNNNNKKKNSGNGNGNKKRIVDRTIMISAFPKEFLSLTTTPKQDMIGPTLEMNNLVGQAIRLMDMATSGGTITGSLLPMLSSLSSSPSSSSSSSTTTKQLLYDLYEQGQDDAEQWIQQEERRNRYQYCKRSLS